MTSATPSLAPAPAMPVITGSSVGARLAKITVRLASVSAVAPPAKVLTFLTSSTSASAPLVNLMQQMAPVMTLARLVIISATRIRVVKIVQMVATLARTLIPVTRVLSQWY
jgi:hypothetical protein